MPPYLPAATKTKMNGQMVRTPGAAPGIPPYIVTEAIIIIAISVAAGSRFKGII